MIKDDRLKLIMKEARNNGRVTIANLSNLLGVSEITIRRDLRELIDRGSLEQSLGGAIFVEMNAGKPEVLRRQDEVPDEKERIGRAAATLVSDGMCIFLGSGSTTVYTARYLKDRRNLTVVTNALNVAIELASADSITTIVAGGVLRPSELAMHGHIVSQSLQDIRVDKVIMGIRGLSLEAGLTNDHVDDVLTFRSFIDLSKDLILVADHTKVGRVAAAYVAPIDRITTLITDSKTDDAFLNCLKERGIQVIIAN
jgi:DeoR/GlpR family transcriptional regulator of sugar metabolism